MIKIMVVDDEQDINLLFKHEFREEIKEKTLCFHFAFSADEALNYLKTTEASDIVLILSDINMPGMNGLELLKIIKEKYPQLPVVMITAYEDDDNFKRAMEYGANNYLTKPLDFDKLRKKIFEMNS